MNVVRFKKALELAMRTHHHAALSLCLICLIFLLASASKAANAVIELSNAELLVSSATQPPPTGAWKPVVLSHNWGTEEYKQGRNGWYRLTIELPEPPKEHWGIYLRRFNMNAALYLNDQFLADGGSFSEPLSRNWNRPLYANVPTSLWRVGTNVIHIRLNSYANYGYLAPIILGPTDILDAEYSRQNLLQIEISTALFPITFATGLFVLALWIKRREDVQYFWFSAAVLMWSIYSLNMAVQDQPFSTKTWEWIAHSAVDWWVLLFGIFTYRFVKKPRPWLEHFYLLYGISACLTYLLVDLETLDSTTRWFHGGSLIIGLIITSGLVRTAWLERNVLYAKLAIGLALLLLMGIHDWMFQYQMAGAIGNVGLHLHHYFSPVIFFFMAWHLTGRFVTALNVSETLNRELEARVHTATKEVERHYSTIQEMEKQQAVMQERERLSREIHDGISGNISNAIMMTELISRDAQIQDNKRVEQLRTHLNDGLGEMRNLILTMEEDLSTLGELLNHVNDKYQQILSSLEIHFETEISALPERQLSQKESLNLLRILQETLNNIIKHAQATEVILRINYDSGNIIFEVVDNGSGFDAKQKNVGHYGLNNMYKRSKEINAQLEITSNKNEGTRVRLNLNAI